MTHPLAVAGWLTATIFIASNAYGYSGEHKKIHKKSPTAATPTAHTAPVRTYAKRPEAQQFAQAMAQRHGLDTDAVLSTLSQARQLTNVQQLMLPPPRSVPKNWAAYRARFIEPVRLKAGQAFWRDNRPWLERAERETGVPASLIVGVLGVETLYGRQMGTFRTLDALATLAFDFPAAHPRATERQAYFTTELEQFLLLTQRLGVDPTTPRSSYAGAMGMPQFMPSSWMRYAVDFDGDGKVDLFSSAADAIGSVAAYFKAYGWQPSVPTHYPVSFDTTRLDLDTLLAPDILPSFSPVRMQSLGAVLPPEAQRHAGQLALVELQNGPQAPSFVAGTENFYCVTRYNWSSYYALAVIELGQAVESALKGDPLPVSLAASPEPALATAPR